MAELRLPLTFAERRALKRLIDQETRRRVPYVEELESLDIHEPILRGSADHRRRYGPYRRREERPDPPAPLQAGRVARALESTPVDSPTRSTVESIRMDRFRTTDEETSLCLELGGLAAAAVRRAAAKAA